jgi:hypothetical protein
MVGDKMNTELPMEFETDYMQSDLHIVKVVITNIFVELQYVMCDLITESGELYQGCCYWYDGVNKNIPFTIPEEDSNYEIVNEDILEEIV